VAAIMRFATRAGDVRLLDYDLTIGEPSVGALAQWNGRRIGATKRITYECRANPLKQALLATLTEFPHWSKPFARKDNLEVDLTYFAARGVPLMRIAEQQDLVRALFDLTSLGLYLFRMLMPLHALTLRLPDRPDSVVAERLPGHVEALPEPEVVQLAVDRMPGNGDPVFLRLTRYRSNSGKLPVLLIHGYSASGTTFVHESLPKGGLVGALHGAGIDAWVLDMRSSSGMPTAEDYWSFEQMGCVDIPLAIEHVLKATGAPKLNIVAHCMGAAMLSLGLFGQWSKAQRFDRFPGARARAPASIEKIVFSQVGPTVIMTPANIGRAYLWSWLQYVAELGHFEFTPENPKPVDDLLDRLLAIVPYPDDEFRRENPACLFKSRATWVGTRHRMDGFYGMTFRLPNMSGKVLDRIDDFFGPCNMKTIAQVIHFAKNGLASDKEGNAAFMNPQRIGAQIGHCEVLSLHATRNGLVDFRNGEALREMLAAAGVRHQRYAQIGMGHQDSLIGRRAEETYDVIVNFLK
jgi:pimeloyl-ACP methyl ester carboxylesterase